MKKIRVSKLDVGDTFSCNGSTFIKIGVPDDWRNIIGEGHDFGMLCDNTQMYGQVARFSHSKIVKKHDDT